MRLSARIFFIFLFSVFCFLSATPFAHAQMTTSIQPDTNLNVPVNMHTYVQSFTLEMLSSTICLLDGQDIIDTSHPCLGIDPKTKKLGYVSDNNHGLLGFVTTMTTALYTPPVRIGDYIGYVSQNFGLVKQSYAAATTCNAAVNGAGFCGISPLIGIWTTFRNIVYLFFVIAFILVGFGIMLRYKIDPRTVMSIENQIPKLIIALLLVTFSFAIAGLLIDGMWVTTFVVTDVLTTADTQNPVNIQDVKYSFFQNPIGFSNNVIPGGILGISAGTGGSVGDLIRGLLTPTNSEKLGLTPPPADCNNPTPLFGGIGNFFCNIGGSLGNILPAMVGYLVSWVVSVLAILVILIAIIASMFRLWFALLLAYIGILLDVVLGPFKIVLGIFPGSKTGFGSWVRDLMSNLLAFPVTIAMFLLARLFMDAFATNGGTASLFVAPLIGNPNGTAGEGNPLGFLIALGFILMTPQAVNMTKGLFKVQDNKYTASIRDAIGVGTGAGPGMMRTASGLGNTLFGLQHLPVVGQWASKIAGNGAQNSASR